MEGEQPPSQAHPLPQNDPAIESGSGLYDPTKPEKPTLQGINFGDRANWNKAVSAVFELEKCGAHTLATQILGIPESTTKEEIEEYIYQQDRIYVARFHGLSDDTPDKVINELLEKEDEENRKARAVAVGLPEAARWDVIYPQEMAKKAETLGLPETAHHSEVWAAEKEQKRKVVFEALGIQENSRWDWEDVLERALCISGSPPTTGDYVKRIQEVREWHIQRIVKGDVGA